MGTNDFLSAHAAKLHGMNDRDVLDIAATQGRILVTQDFRTMPKQLRCIPRGGTFELGRVFSQATHTARVGHRGARARLDGY
jgi:hypothetical protein